MFLILNLNENLMKKILFIFKMSKNNIDLWEYHIIVLKSLLFLFIKKYNKKRIVKNKSIIII